MLTANARIGKATKSELLPEIIKRCAKHIVVLFQIKFTVNHAAGSL